MTVIQQPTPKHKLPIEQQILMELQELRRAVEQIASAVSKLANDLPHALRG